MNTVTFNYKLNFNGTDRIFMLVITIIFTHPFSTLAHAPLASNCVVNMTPFTDRSV